jgi:hypothetical protein
MTALGPRQKPRPTAAAAARTRRASEWQAMLVLTQSASASPELPRRNRACSLALNHGHCSRHGSERRTGYGTFLTEVCLTSVIAKSRVKEYLSWVLAKVCCSGYWAFQSQSSFFWRSSGTTKARTPTEFVGCLSPTRRSAAVVAKAPGQLANNQRAQDSSCDLGRKRNSDI